MATRATLGIILLLTGILLSTAGLAQPRVITVTPYLNAAQQVANWLESLAVDTGNGALAWPISNINQQRLLGLDQGAAGIGRFFVELYRQTGDDAYLDIAISAARYERSQHITGQYNGPDWLAGAAGSGEFLLELYAASGDRTFLQWAEDIAAWHTATALRPAPDENFWLHAPNFPRTYTGIAHGAAGIGMFHSRLYMHTGNPEHLTLAENAYNWMNNYRINLSPNAFGYQRLITDTDIYNWWSGGSAGIMLFQSRMYQITGETRYLDDYRQTANGLLLVARDEAVGQTWRFGREVSNYRPIVYGHGNASVVDALYDAHETAGDQRYLAAADNGAAWIESQVRDFSTQTTGLLFWPHNIGSGGLENLLTTSVMIGTASVGDSMLRFFTRTGNKRWLELALRNADYLLEIAEQPVAGSIRWLNYLGPENPNWDPQQYNTGWYDGNAGIGLFMLAVHRTLTLHGSL